MIPKHRFLTTFASIALVASVAQGQTYTVTDLGALPEKMVDVSTAAAINNQGQVAGTSGGTPVDQSAFRYNPNTQEGIQNLGTAPFNSLSRGFGINASGRVVGDSTFGDPSLVSRAALFGKGSAADLGLLKNSGPYSRANGINASSEVVGFCGPKPDSSSSRAFIWSASSGMLDLGTLGGGYAQALAINDSGFVTGNSETAYGQPGSTHAFIYRRSTTGVALDSMVDLGTLGGASSYGTAINPDNHIVGYSTINNSDSRLHAFLYNDGKMQDLGSLGVTVDSDNSFALGINTNDQVVGYAYVSNQEGPMAPNNLGTAVAVTPTQAPRQVAFVYSRGTMQDLNQLIGAAAQSYRLDSATAINDNGQIVVNALDYATGSFHAVLLTPSAFQLLNKNVAPAVRKPASKSAR